jgi:hypothetical protein
MPSDWSFTIPRAVPSANDRLCNGRDRVSRAMYARARDSWANDLAVMMRVHGIPAATAPRRVTITRLWGKRQRLWDDDNLSGGAKLVRDAMRASHAYKRKGATRWVVGAGLIVDDSARWVTVDYVQVRAPDGVAATRIDVSDAPPAGGSP